MTNSRATCRGGHRCEPSHIREALHCQFTHATMPLEQLASLEGINAHTLAAMVNPDRDDNWPPMRRLHSLLSRTSDHDAYARFIAKQSLGEYYRIPVIADSASEALVTAIAEQTTQLSEAVGAIDRALRTESGITVDELPKINREIDDIVESSMRLKSTVKRCAVPRVTAAQRKRP